MHVSVYIHVFCIYVASIPLKVAFFSVSCLGLGTRVWESGRDRGLTAWQLGSHALGRQTGPATPAPVRPGLRAASQADSGSVLHALGQGLPARPAEARRAGEPPQKGLRGETEARGI